LLAPLVVRSTGMDVVAWIKWANETSKWLRALQENGWSTDAMDKVEWISQVVAPRCVVNRRQANRRMGEVDDVDIVYRVIHEAKERVVAWRVRQGGVCANRPSRVERAGV
jgi:hypothetical protein